MLISKEKQHSLQVLSFGASEGTPIRVQVINNEAWFVAKDVCQVLGIANHIDAVSRLDEDEKSGVGITDPIGRNQTVNIVNESGLYHLIFQSRKPEARKFRRWVTGEVLPQIRKTGSYSSVRKELLPRERSAELGAFHRELRQWVTHEDERTVASLMNVTRDHVHRVLVGGKQSYGVLCMLVDCAKDNRKAGRMRVETTPARRKEQIEQLRLEFMEGKEAEDGKL